jgi:hypothetical protein
LHDRVVAEQALAYRGEEDEDAETGACFKKDVSRGAGASFFFFHINCAGRRRERRRTRPVVLDEVLYLTVLKTGSAVKLQAEVDGTRFVGPT